MVKGVVELIKNHCLISNFVLKIKRGLSEILLTLKLIVIYNSEIDRL